MFIEQEQILMWRSCITWEFLPCFLSSFFAKAVMGESSTTVAVPSFLQGQTGVYADIASLPIGIQLFPLPEACTHAATATTAELEVSTTSLPKLPHHFGMALFSGGNIECAEKARTHGS